MGTDSRVYADAAEPMRNLTVFDGLAMITSGWGGGGDNSTVDVPISGFLTPPFGPVDLNLGVVAYDGDRGSSGDQLGFDGTGIVQLHRRCHARHQQRIQQHPLHWRHHESMAGRRVQQHAWPRCQHLHSRQLRIRFPSEQCDGRRNTRDHRRGVHHRARHYFIHRCLRARSARHGIH